MTSGRPEYVTYGHQSHDPSSASSPSFSIPAQLKLLREYARSRGLRVVEEYVDIETVKQTGRASFERTHAALTDLSGDFIRAEAGARAEGHG